MQILNTLPKKANTVASSNSGIEAMIYFGNNTVNVVPFSSLLVYRSKIG